VASETEVPMLAESFILSLMRLDRDHYQRIKAVRSHFKLASKPARLRVNVGVVDYMAQLAAVFLLWRHHFDRRGVEMKFRTIVLMSMLVALLASACASTQPITEPVAVIEAFYEALNEGDLDTAMSFVADDATFIRSAAYIGKADISDFYQESLDLGFQAELSDLRADGDKVSWMEKLTIGGGRFEVQLEAIVRDGLIVLLTIT